MMPQPSARNHRNNPYILDRAFVQVRHSAAGVLWRFRTEAMVLVTGTAGMWELAKAVTTAWLMVILIMTGTAVTVVDTAGLDPMQEAFKEHHGLQCGYCTPGMMLVGKTLVDRNPEPSDDDVRAEPPARRRRRVITMNTDLCNSGAGLRSGNRAYRASAA